MRVLMCPAKTADDDNPFISILVSGIRSAGAQVEHFDYRPRDGFDAFHVHWLEGVFWGRVAGRVSLVASLRARALIEQATRTRASGGRVVWTVHNLLPHEALSSSRAAVWSLLCEAFLPLVTDVILMSPDTTPEVQRLYPQVAGAKVHEVPHPHYREFFARHADLSALPRAPGPIRLACVGKLRPYKGVLELVEQLGKVDRDFELTIAGDGPADHVRAIASAVRNDTRFRLNARALTHGEVVTTLRVADAAAFNFERILNSGSVLAALSAGVPVLCPSAPALDALGQQVGPQWLRTFMRPVTADWILDCAEDFIAARSADLLAPLDKLSPDAVGRDHAALYAGVR
ncbi:MAG TPA: glycosyltransferase [Brevundimonas sp.]|jgi:glycosyltransferase involved in cell wall biosynthesis|uniref:glycosyltransferase n=1 Tax=Brevundimonas sp. TaxID=1871086 RepID=UPI002E10B3A3|nr:glycosyltransferase [Brevundimonas sp.]